MLDSTFVEALIKQGQNNQRAAVYELPGLPRTVFVDQGGRSQAFDREPPIRRHTISSRESLLQAVVELGRGANVFVSQCAIGVLLSGTERSDQLRMPMEVSDRFARLMKLRQSEFFSPREAVRLMRFDLRAGNNKTMIDALSNIDFSRMEQANASTRHGGETLGASVELAVQNAEKVPQEFTVTVPVFKTGGFERYIADVQVGVFLDAEKRKVELRTLPDEIERAMAAELKEIASDLVTTLNLNTSDAPGEGDPRHLVYIGSADPMHKLWSE